MESSDEEGEVFFDVVSDYEFINQEDHYVSFAYLPLLWHKDDYFDDVNLKIFLSGTCDDGLQKIYKQVVAWRYEISCVQPEILVLCKDNHWVKLLKPRKVFEAMIRSILITIQCLHFVKHNPTATKNSMWIHLSRVFSTFEIAPSEVDCMSHISLIRKAAERDITLMNSEIMLGILLEKSTKGKVLQMEGLQSKRSTKFIVNEFVDKPCELNDSVNDGDDLFDTCCSICDNGGDILCCEGRCMRSFHATLASGEGLCESLGLSATQVDAIANFFCKNCQYQQHQCFICGKLGSSNVSSSPEVFPCIAANCGRFYHPRCVSKALYPQNDIQLKKLQKEIASGESFTCPTHKCYICKQTENREVGDLQFAVCRRCPKSYHRKCLPREITFGGNGILQRAWDGLLQKRILIFCMDHEIDPYLGTPLRNHIFFPDTSNLRERVLDQHLNRVNVHPKKQNLNPVPAIVERKAVLRADKLYSSHKGIISTQQVGKGSSNPSCNAQIRKFSSIASTRKDHVNLCRKPLALGIKSTIRKSSEKSRFDSEKYKKSKALQHYPDYSCKKLKVVQSAKPLIEKQRCINSPVDINMERRINALIEKVDSDFNVDEFKKQQVVPSVYKTSQSTLDKSLTKVKVEVAVKAVQTALQMLNNGGTVEDAKAVCSVEMLQQIPMWKKKLDIFLAPFLHGMAYSSYGRHFTKLEKLQKIVERLHWYVQDGDMIVDFCCGANDFSCLMKKKLDSIGKNCHFKNYDLFQAKNDFNFEQRDWFTVNPNELPEGSRVIMGLNPPFGYKASLANQFINKALQFRPKLLILIVPPETHRLDVRTDWKRYDLIWEDPHLLAGESFYLPGSIGTDDNRLSQWNKITPPLYLWSHPEWTLKHREIAIRSGQIKPSQQPTWIYPLPEQHDCYGDFSNLMNMYGKLPAMLDDIPEHNYDHELGEHQLSRNFNMSNGAAFDNSSSLPSFVNPLTMDGAGAGRL
ncbi:protein ENHANCED DOWNY MILDEW 2-like [Amaranthus tricolor]|uniref:protein ENHANCED DOWNY MILDEW 2-like n=1 Tax=Amaranthus tricolor TaxID=29722 RepID=UPI0025885A1C|nr:protein ENHANCED DOWNY MILDEW 2-like [Amaranthus tricolor]